MINWENEGIIDDLGEAHLFTLETYLEHMKAGRYGDGHDCLYLARHVSLNMMDIEDRIIPTPLTFDQTINVAKAGILAYEPKDD